MAGRTLHSHILTGSDIETKATSRMAKDTCDGFGNGWDGTGKIRCEICAQIIRSRRRHVIVNVSFEQVGSETVHNPVTKFMSRRALKPIATSGMMCAARGAATELALAPPDLLSLWPD